MDVAGSSDTPVNTASCLRRLDSSICDLCNRLRAVTGVIGVLYVLCAGKHCPQERTYSRTAVPIGLSLQDRTGAAVCRSVDVALLCHRQSNNVTQQLHDRLRYFFEHSVKQ
jgi:hypothetical protein